MKFRSIAGEVNCFSFQNSGHILEGFFVYLSRLLGRKAEMEYFIGPNNSVVLKKRVVGTLFSLFIGEMHDFRKMSNLIR